MIFLFFVFQITKDDNYANIIKIKLNENTNIINEEYDISFDAIRSIHRTPYRRFGRQELPFPREVIQRQRNNLIFLLRQ